MFLVLFLRFVKNITVFDEGHGLYILRYICISGFSFLTSEEVAAVKWRFCFDRSWIMFWVYGSVDVVVLIGSDFGFSYVEY